MKITVLGKYGPYPAPGGACSGYLLEDSNTRVLIDCGSGVLSKLQKLCSIADIDGIILSHLHSDHMSDILVLRYALDIIAGKGMLKKEQIPMYLPASPQAEHSLIQSSGRLKLTHIEDSMICNINSLTISFSRMTHPYESYGMAITNNKVKLVYTGDTGFNPNIAVLASNADLLMADTGFMQKDLIKDSMPHLSAEQVGKIAAEANVKRLLLTHINPMYDEESLRAEAAAFYKEPEVAAEMKTYTLL